MYVLGHFRPILGNESTEYRLPVIHELELAGCIPTSSGIVETTGEVCRATVGCPSGGVSSAMAVEEVQTSNTAGFRSLGARVNAEGTALNAEPGRQVSPMLEYIE